MYLTDQNGNATQLSWSPNGYNLERTVDAEGYTATMQYDGLNNLKVITSTRGFTTAFVYSGTLVVQGKGMAEVLLSLPLLTMIK